MRVSALTLEYPQRTRCAAAHGTGRHWVRRPAIRAPDDGRAEWFAVARIAPPGFWPASAEGGQIDAPAARLGRRTERSVVGRRLRRVFLPAIWRHDRAAELSPSPSRSNLRAGSCRVQEWRACATRSRLVGVGCGSKKQSRSRDSRREIRRIRSATLRRSPRRPHCSIFKSASLRRAFSACTHPAVTALWRPRPSRCRDHSSTRATSSNGLQPGGRSPSATFPQHPGSSRQARRRPIGQSGRRTESSSLPDDQSPATLRFPQNQTPQQDQRAGPDQLSRPRSVQRPCRRSLPRVGHRARDAPLEDLWCQAESRPRLTLTRRTTRRRLPRSSIP